MPEYKIRPSTIEDAPAILALIARAPDALLSVTQAEIQAWISLGHSLVAQDATGQIIGHQGLGYWEKSQMAELRAAYVDPVARGQGLNTAMKVVMMNKAKQLYPDSTFVGFTEPASLSRGILVKLGYEEIPLLEAPDELFSICPVSCVKKTGVNCGCKIFIKK